MNNKALYVNLYSYFVNILCFELWLAVSDLFKFISVEIVTLNYAKIQKVKLSIEFENWISSTRIYAVHVIADVDST